MLRQGALLLALLLVACQASPPPITATSAFPAVGGAQPSSSQVPIDADDGVWGSATAPVTLVVFTDLQCPFCARGHEAVRELEARYGAERLRVVVKHVPLSGHEGAIPAARVAQAVLELGGPAKFFAYLERAFAAQDRVAHGDAVELAVPLGIELQALSERAGSAAVGQAVLADTTLAERLAVAALPHFRINGRGFTGAYPVRALADFIDAELVATRDLASSGIPADQVYSQRVARNVNLEEPE